MLFSIIIPAYNAEKTIGYCLDSVISQDFPANEFEVIVVDDCSPDNQNNVITHYTTNRTGEGNKSKPVVTLIKHKENKRQGGARNTALKAAKGDWIMFLDADDYWHSTKVLETYSRLITQYPNADIFESATYSTSYEKTLSTIETEEIIAAIKKPSEYYYANPHPCIWAAAYSKELISKHPFREKVYYEDTDWKIRVFTKAEKIVTFDYPFYVYSQNPGSTTNAKSIKAYEDAVTANIICGKEWKESGLSEEQIAGILSDGKKYYLRSILDVRNYNIKDSIHLLRYLTESGYGDTIYGLSPVEKMISQSSKHIPLLTIIVIKTLTAIKRIITRTHS